MLEILFNQFFATTASTDLKKVSQPSCLASFMSLDNLIPCPCRGTVGCVKVVTGGLDTEFDPSESKFELRHIKNSCKLGTLSESSTGKIQVVALVVLGI